MRVAWCVLQAIEVVAVCVPMVSHVAVQITRGAAHRNDGHTDLGQPPSQQNALAADVLAECFSNPFGFAVQVKRSLHFRVDQQICGQLSKMIVVVDSRAA